MKKALTMLLVCVLAFMSLSNISYAGISVFDGRKGDINNDGTLSFGDIRSILRAAAYKNGNDKKSDYLYDMNSDGFITAADIRSALRVYKEIDYHPDDIKNAELKIKDIVDGVSDKELSRLIKTLCQYGSRSIFYPESHVAAQNFIKKELKSYGYNISTQPFSYASCDTENIVTTLNKKDKHKDILLLSTHYDCWDGAHGAIDNASGVATLLYVAKVLKESNLTFNKEIRFAFFSAEELGYHGAYHYISQLSQKEKSNIAVFNIDMTGPSALGGGRFLTVSTEPVSGSYVWREAQTNEISLAIHKAHRITGGAGEKKFYDHVSAGRHDIVPFRENNIPAVTLSWRGIREDAAYGSDYDLAPPSQIHTPLDTIDNFDFEAFYKTTALVLATVVLEYT